MNELKPAGMRVRDLEKQLEELDTAQNRLLLAVAYKDAGQLDRAETMLTQTRQGIYKNDPHVTYDLADVKFQMGKLEDARELLRELVDVAPEELRGKTRLLLARAVQAEQPDEADALFQRAISSFSGEEARYWYAAFLIAQGKRDAAEAQVKTLERNVRRASGTYRYQQREWLERATKLLK
ncbi:MAG: tetratricopeptide repeat protein [Pleurocapsa sp. SU_196_0]|nr:tetratricopeptide repeat protein [Pleurocapsa sp. SU_196_0]